MSTICVSEALDYEEIEASEWEFVKTNDRSTKIQKKNHYKL